MINSLEKWTFENGFNISKNKTIPMHFCPNEKMHWPSFEMTLSSMQKKLSLI